MSRTKSLKRQEMKKQAPEIRITNFAEVSLGFTEEMALIEANRCLQCAKPTCVNGCPVNIDILAFIKCVKDKEFEKAIHIIKESNLLPSICGRVCPQEIQCEQECVLGRKHEPIAIGALERFVGDWERKHQLKACPDCLPPNGIKVAVIGSGPAGLTCAADLARLGYEVTIFEALHGGGGVLLYGIPEFRLPKEIVKDELETLEMLGVKIKYNHVIGKLLDIRDLEEMGFQAFFLGVGAGLPQLLNIEGIELNGVLTANEFLTRVNLMKAYKFPEYDTPIDKGKNVTVIGGGNVAMDSARVALRLGADKVMLVYRRTEKEMPARKEEILHGKEEGIQFLFLANPVRLIGDENGNVKEMELIKMKLGELDESGRRSPIPIKNSNFKIKTNMVIIAIGTRANKLLLKSIPQLKLSKKGYVIADEEGRTNIENIFAGGDIVTGTETVISAMGAGRRAAKAIDQYLKKKLL
ncbi:MAG: NADPH-dependent glutamate synthase [Promethearchaeota archaeon]